MSNNPNLMREVKLYDNHHERENMENMSELFACLNALECLEKMFVKDQVSATEYNTECFKLLDQLKVVMRLVPGNVTEFAAKYRLHCPAALERIREGRPITVKDDKGNLLKNIASIVEVFITFFDQLKLGVRAVDELFPNLNELYTSIMAMSRLPEDFDGKVTIKKCEKSRKRSKKSKRELKEVVARYCCTKCDKIFTDLGKAQRHEKRMHRDPATKVLPTCNQCNKTFTSPHLLVEHISVVHEHLKPFKCDKCDQTFGRSGGLRRHVLMVHENKMFMCPYDDCDHPGYKCSKALTAHIRSKHTHERPYECMYCEKSFVRKNDLRVHEMTHSSEPHFKCGVCGTGFRRESYLRRHRMHCGLVKEEVKPKKKALRLKPPKKAKKSKKKKN